MVKMSVAFSCEIVFSLLLLLLPLPSPTLADIVDFTASRDELSLHYHIHSDSLFKRPSDSTNRPSVYFEGDETFTSTKAKLENYWQEGKCDTERKREI